MSHPRIAQFEHLYQPAQSAAALHYRLPAEWEPMACVWVSPPTNPETWPRCLNAADAQFDAWINELRRFAPVCTPESLGIATDDAWIRDYGPLFVVREQAQATRATTVHEASAVGTARRGPPAIGRSGDPATATLGLHDFHFNTWGQKYERRQRDDLVPQHLAAWLGAPIWVHDLVLEGGAIDTNGRGTLMTTEQCLFSRNKDVSREAIEAALRDAFNISHIIWLPGGISSDDTDGHIDDVARFVASDTVLAASAPEGHPDHDVLQRNLAALRQARDQDGTPLHVIELPVPAPMHYDYPPDRFDEGGRQALPGSYANFLICNGAVFVPTFGQHEDEAALRVIEQALPNHELIPVRSEWLIVGRGALHCLSMPQPVVGV